MGLYNDRETVVSMNPNNIFIVSSNNNDKDFDFIEN